MIGRNWRLKALLGEDHVWLGFEAERDSPSEISRAVAIGEEVRRRRIERKKMMELNFKMLNFLKIASCIFLTSR